MSKSKSTMELFNNYAWRRRSSIIAFLVLLINLLHKESWAWVSPPQSSLSSKHHRWTTTVSLSSDPNGDLTIRNCEYAELGAVAEIIMESFYDSKTKSTWRRLYQLAELNRLQQNFPYTDPDLHQMLVAVAAENKEVVGFCDADARPSQTKPKLPRPYLSDLAVHPDHRRRGIAKALVKASEEFVRGIPRTELFIRVEETNEAAVTMYDHLEYQTTGSEDTKDKGTILILHKEWDTDSQTSLVESSSDSEIAI